jgi:predicted nucleic acid-binding protein
MLGIDTNVIVRYLTGDHPEQSGRARRLIDSEQVFVSTTVLLETEWVLRGVYGYPGRQVAAALGGFAGLPNVVVEDAALAAQALEWMAAGVDFADALHLARARHCDGFITFDRRFARAADRLGAIKVRAP